jgi:hypothetical protein
VDSHRTTVQGLLGQAAAEHQQLTARLPPDVSESIPVDAQGITRAIDHLASAVGFSDSDRRELVRPHGVNPAVMHARVFGAAPLARETVIGAFVDGARVRAEALTALADEAGGEPLGLEIRTLLSDNPLPAPTDEDAVSALRRAYLAHERAALLIAAVIDRQR